MKGEVDCMVHAIRMDGLNKNIISTIQDVPNVKILKKLPKRLNCTGKLKMDQTGFKTCSNLSNPWVVVIAEGESKTCNRSNFFSIYFVHMSFLHNFNFLTSN